MYVIILHLLFLKYNRVKVHSSRSAMNDILVFYVVSFFKDYYNLFINLYGFRVLSLYFILTYILCFLRALKMLNFTHQKIAKNSNFRNNLLI